MQDSFGWGVTSGIEWGAGIKRWICAITLIFSNSLLCLVNDPRAILEKPQKGSLVVAADLQHSTAAGYMHTWPLYAQHGGEAFAASSFTKGIMGTADS